MQLVTLTTDWGYSDHYIGAVKAKLYTAIKDCQVVDITHSIEKYNLMSGAFIVKNACLNFPEGTIHIIDVDCTESSKNNYQHVVIEYNKQYFICTDNGMPSMIFDDLSQIKIIGITNTYQESSYYTFSAFDLFCKVAAILTYNTSIDELGYEMTELVRRNILTATIFSNSILCTAFHVDSYGNVFLNLKIEEFLAKLGNDEFLIEIESNKIKAISKSYDDVRENSPLLTVSSTGHLQIAINKANASELLGYRTGSQISIKLIKKK